MELQITFMIIYAMKAEEFTEVIEAFGYAIANIGIMMICINFLMKLKEIKKLFESLGSVMKFSADPRFKERTEIVESVGIAYKVYKAVWFTAIAGCTIAGFVPIASHRLPYKIWFPFLNTKIGFWIGSYYQVLIGFCVSAIAVTLLMLPSIFLSFAIGFTNELANRLVELGKPVKVVETGPGPSKERFVKP